MSGKERTLSAVIVDDELFARDGIKSMLSRYGQVEVIGEFADGIAATHQIIKLKPDVVFLDMEMPGRTGLEVVAEVGPDRMPDTVFITAYDQYAVEAFHVAALDYLVKPFSDERFDETMERVIARWRSASAAGRGDAMRDLMSAWDGMGWAAGSQRFTIKVGETLKVHHLDEIDWIQADNYYSKVHVGGRGHLVRQSLANFEKELPPRRFVRVHRGAIVNIERIDSIEPMTLGDAELVLVDGTRIRVSRRRRDALLESIPQLGTG